MTSPEIESVRRSDERGLTNGYAVASLVLGIVWYLWLGSLLAIVFGHVARSQTLHNDSPRGRGMATAGLVLGYGGMLMLALTVMTGGNFHLTISF